MVTLRRAAAGDIGTVQAILAASAGDLTARFGEGHWSGVRSVETLRKYVCDGVLYVVEADDVPLGTLRLTERKIGVYRNEWFADPEAHAFYLMDRAIHPTHQRSGIGRQSLVLAEGGPVRWRKATAIRLDAYEGRAGAGEFYRKCGYSLVHRSAFRGVSLEYFEKLLTDGP